jgi:hypothetical protein
MQAAHVPNTITFATESAPASAMIGRTIDARVLFPLGCCNPVDFSLDHVGVEFDATIIKGHGQTSPMAQCIAHRTRG